MRPNPLSINSGPLILDASVAINLSASGSAGQILSCLPNRILIPSLVFDEIKRGVLGGRDHLGNLVDLESAGLLRVEPLSGNQEADYEALVSGSAVKSLDDGEAATIACARAVGGVAAIDERKATVIAGERFPGLPLATSCDLFSCDAVIASLGRAALADAVYLALVDARMHVLSDYVGWIIDLLGRERAEKCRSIPRRAFEKQYPPVVAK